MSENYQDCHYHSRFDPLSDGLSRIPENHHGKLEYSK